MIVPYFKRPEISYQDALPRKVDIVIIGGGIIGVFAALYLNRAGKKVMVCEKGRIAAEQSSRNWGWLCQQGCVEAELPIIMNSMRLWKEIDAEVGGQCGFQNRGSIWLARSRAELEKRAQWIEVSKKFDLETRLLSRIEMNAVFAQSPGNQWCGGLITPSDAQAEPWQAVPTVAKLAHEEGVLIREACAVRSLDIVGGKVNGVHTENGKIACDQVVLAGGAWSSLFAQNHSVAIPQLNVYQTVAQTAVMPEFFSGCAYDGDFSFRRRHDGSYSISLSGTNYHAIGPDSLRWFFKWLPTMMNVFAEVRLLPNAPKAHPNAWRTPRKWEANEVSPFEKMRVLDPAPNPAAVNRMKNYFAAQFPKLGKPQIQNFWGGMVDAMPDGVPIVDHVSKIPGLIMATGMSGHGFVSGPGFAKIVADLAIGQKPEYDIRPFRFNRFSDGTKLIPATGI